MTNIRKKGFALLALVMVLTLMLTCVLVACGENDTQSDKEYSLTFDPNYEGAEPTTVNIKANDAESYPAPSRDGYTFVGWTFDKSGKVPFDKYRLESGMTIYAQWEKIAAAMYTVRFLDHEGKNVIDTQQVEAGNAAIEPTESEYSSFIPSGYLFDGWDKSFDNINADTDVTMLIKEEQITPPPVVNEYTVRFFDPSGEELLAKRTVKEGEGATPPPASVLEGYFDPAKEAFSHWVTLDGESCDITNITANLDVKMVVISTVEIVTVTFKNGDETITSFEGEVGMGIPQKVDAPSKDGFNFYRFETAEGKVFDENSKFSANEIYFATWTIATPTTPAIVLDKDSYVYGESIALSLGGKVEHAGLSYTYEWLDEKDSVLASGLTYQATTKVVGTHSFKVRVTASASGYTSASATSTATFVSVDKASLTATVQPASVVYGDTAPSQYDIVLSGFAYGENDSVVDKSSLTFDCTYSAGLGIGNYNVSASGLNADNYDIIYANGTLTVTQKDIAISKQDSAVYAKVAIEKRYDSLTNTALLDGHVLSLVVKTNSANVGVYKNTDSINNLSSTVSIVDKDGANVIANYNVSVDASFEITPATIAYTMPSNLEFTYNANSHSATLSDVTDNIQVLYSVDGTNYSTSVPTFVNAGSYKVYAKMSRANYTDEETSFVIVINRADVTISANALITTYGKAFKQSDLTYTASIAGNFDVTLSTDYSQGASVGTYDIKVDVKDDANFNITKVDATITVEKAQLIATISSASIVYGEDFTPTTSLVQLEGLLAGDDAMLTMSTAYTLGDGVGKYAISCESANTNYTFTAEDGTLNVTKRALTITIGSQNIVYGQNYQELEHSITAGSLALEDSYTIEDMTAYVVGGNVGEYPLSANVVIANDKADNYDVKVVDGTLNVSQYAITLTITKPANIVYGDEKPEFAYTLDKEVVAGDVISVDYTTTYAVGSDAGKYSVGAIATFANGEDDKTDNYAIKYNPTSFDVAQRFVDITINAQSAVYGDTLPTLTHNVKGEFASCDKVEITLTHDDATNVGVYPISANILVNGEAVNTTNYVITVKGANLTISKRDVTITLNSGNITYGDDFTAMATLTGEFLASDNVVVTPTLAYSVGDDAGEYVVSATHNANSANYNVTVKDGSLNVARKELTVSANNANITYGDTAPSYTNNKGEVIALDTLVVTTSSAYVQGANAGTYAITNNISITRDGDDKSANYNITNDGATLTVDKKDASVAYAGETVVYGDSALLAYTGDVALYDFAVGYSVGDVAGSYDVTATLKAEHKANYHDVSSALGKITVVAREITVAINDMIVIYGDEIASPTYEASYADAKTYVVITSDYTRGDNVGTSRTFSASLNSAAEGRYVLDLDNSTIGNITVAKKTIVVTPEDLTKVYDGVVPTIKFTSTDLVGSDTLDITFEGIGNVNVGTYTVRANAITHDNYVIDNSASATLTINPRPVKVTANSVSVGYNNPAPSITFSTDFADANEFITVSVPSYTVGNNAGNYPLVASVSGSDNFTISADSVLGNLVVEPVKVVLTTSDTTVVYGDVWTAPTFTTDIEGAHDYFTITTDYVVGSGVGTYAYKYASSNPNYTADLANSTVGKLTVTPAPLTITLNQHDAITYGDAVPTDFSATIVGAKNGELDALASALVFSTLYTATSNASQTGYDYYLDTVETNKAEVFANYTYSAPASLKLVVNKKDYAPGEFSHRDLEVTYAPALTLASLYLDANFEWGNANTSVGDAGVHTFDAQYLGDENHNPCAVTVKVTVLKAPVTITGTTVQEFNFASGTTHTFSTADFKAMYGDTDVTSLGSFVDVLSTGDAGTFGFNMAFTSTNYSGTIKCYMKVKSVDVGGILYTIEDALNTATSGTIKLTTSTSFADEFNSCYNSESRYYTIKSGVTLFLPYSSTDTTGWLGAGESGETSYDSHPGSNGTPTLYINLTVPDGVNIVANGNITVGAVTGKKDAGAEQNKVSGAYSQITLNGTLTTNSVTLRVMGYITGSGSITTNSTTVIENLYISGWMGGTISTGRYAGGNSVSIWSIIGGGNISFSKDPNMFPFSQYELRSIQVKSMTLNYGSKLQGYTKIATSAQSESGINVPAQINEAYLTFVTNSTNDGDGLLRMENGSTIVKSYVYDKEKKNYRTVFDLYGKVNDGYTTMNLNVIGCTASMSSAKIIFPINGLTTINVKSGATFTQSYKFKLLPGATLTVDSGATYNLNGTTVMYDKTFTDISTYSYPGAARGDSVMTINGTMNLNGAFGGNVTGTGKVVVGSSATVSNVKSVEGTGSGYADKGAYINAKYVFTFEEDTNLSVTRDAQANGVTMSQGQTYQLTA